MPAESDDVEPSVGWQRLDLPPATAERGPCAAVPPRGRRLSLTLRRALYLREPRKGEQTTEEERRWIRAQVQESVRLQALRAAGAAADAGVARAASDAGERHWKGTDAHSDSATTRLADELWPEQRT